MRYFDDYVVGEIEELDGEYLVSEEEIREVGERWDPQPFHVDPVAAAASVFGGLVASSVHLFAMCISLGVKAKPAAAISSLGFRALVNHAPVRPEDVLTARVTTLEKRLSKSRPGVGVVTTSMDMVNQRDELVFSCENTALIRCRRDTDSAAD